MTRPSIRRLGSHYERVVLFGANHYAGRLPAGTTLVWVKRNDEAFGTFLSDAEIAWMKGGCGVYCYRAFRLSGRTNHPTEKPVDLMRWVLGRVGGESGITLDPFMGSGSTLVAAKSLGRRAVGVEIEERYREIAAKRLAQEEMFTEPAERVVRTVQSTGQQYTMRTNEDGSFSYDYLPEKA